MKKLVLLTDPETAQTQYEAGLEDRKLVVYPSPDHTTNLLITNISPEDALEASRNLHARALELKRLPGETRTLQQIMADLAIDHLKGNQNTDAPGLDLTVQVNPGQPTAHVTGYGPILPASL